MEYKLKTGEQILDVNVEVQAGDLARFTIEGKTQEARFTRVSEHHLLLAISGPHGFSNVHAFVANGPEGKTILLNGIPYQVEDQDARDVKKSRKAGPLSGPSEVTPLTPAVVARVLVAAGEHVEQGQAVIVVSAMKMETTLAAPFAGVVAKISVAPGDKVLPGQILVHIEKDPESGQEAP